MKELIKPQKLVEQTNSASAYCEIYCGGHLDNMYSYSYSYCPGGFNGCTKVIGEEGSDDILF